jgi:UDP-3-O-[3-hydroxymyristoyl] glucosamine N-acyltransferase
MRNLEVAVPKLASILDFLEDLQIGTRVVGGGAVEEGPAICAVARDQFAAPGEMAWVSSRALEADPGRLRGFGGTLLICPAEADPEQRGGTWYVVCSNPKLAIIEVITEFFGEQTTDGLPDRDQGPIHPRSSTGQGVRLGPGVVLGSGVSLDDDVVVGPNTVLARCTVGRGTVIGANCTIGLSGFGMEKRPTGRWLRFPHTGHVEIGADVEIGSNVCIDRGSIGDTVIGNGVRIDNLVHVAHNVVIEDNALVIANAMLGGSVRLGRDSWIAPSSSIMNQATIGSGAVVGLGAVVLGDVAADQVVVGNPARELKKKGG